MALTNKGTRWENKNSLFLIFSFIPILDFVPFFHMNSRVENKKYKKMGWWAVALNIIFIFLIVIAMIFTIQIFTYDRTGLRDYENTAPKLEDFLGYNYYEKYPNYMEMPEYEEYLKAQDEWNSREDIIEASRHADSVEMAVTYSFVGIVLLYCIFHIIIIILAFNSRPNYLRELSKVYSTSDAFKRLSNIKSSVADKGDTTLNETDINKDNEEIAKIDINTSTEEELSQLMGITIIDAKKAISYREENNGFKNLDEFFDCINAKPHIIVALESKLVVGDYKNSKSNRTEGNGKRQLDL